MRVLDEELERKEGREERKGKESEEAAVFPGPESRGEDGDGDGKGYGMGGAWLKIED